MTDTAPPSASAFRHPEKWRLLNKYKYRWNKFLHVAQMPRGSLTWSLMKATVTWIVVYNVAALATYGWDHPRINFTYNQMRERGALTEEQKSKEEALNSYYAAQGEFVTDLFLLRAEPQFDAASMIKTSRF